MNARSRIQQIKEIICHIHMYDRYLQHLKNFLKYLVDGTVSDDFTEELSKEVDIVRNNKEWRIYDITDD